jgi:hypothetical protein
MLNLVVCKVTAGFKRLNKADVQVHILLGLASSKMFATSYKNGDITYTTAKA